MGIPSNRAVLKKEQIRTAARKLFLEHGYSGSSMDAICKLSGVSKQTLYSYYSGKEDLVVDVLRQQINKFEDQDQLQLEKRIPENLSELIFSLQKIARSLIETLMDKDYIALVRIIISETPRIPKIGELFRQSVPEQILNTIKKLLKACWEKGIIKNDKFDVLTRMFVGSLLTFVLMDGLFKFDQPNLPDLEKIDEIVLVFMDAL